MDDATMLAVNMARAYHDYVSAYNGDKSFYSEEEREARYEDYSHLLKEVVSRMEKKENE